MSPALAFRVASACGCGIQHNRKFLLATNDCADRPARRAATNWIPQIRSARKLDVLSSRLRESRWDSMSPSMSGSTSRDVLCSLLSAMEAGETSDKEPHPQLTRTEKQENSLTKTKEKNGSEKRDLFVRTKSYVRLMVKAIERIGGPAPQILPFANIRLNYPCTKATAEHAPTLATTAMSLQLKVTCNP